MKTIYTTLLFAMLTLAASAQLQHIYVPVAFLPDYTALVQNSQLTTNGNTTTLAKATEFSITAKSLLPIIAQDEFNAGRYGSTNFPAGAQIVFMTDPSSFADSYYVVEDKTGNALVTLTNLMSLEPEGGFIVYSFKETLATGLSDPYQDDYVAILSYDDTGLGGTTKFAVSFLLQGTEEAKPISKGRFTDTFNTSLSAECGTGSFGGQNALVYGNAVKFTAHGTYPLP
jgi:hypothetical protein